MQIFPYILATASPSEELPYVWFKFAFAAFIIACLLTLAVLMRSLVTRRASAWFVPTTFAAMVFGLAPWIYAAYVYRIDYVAVGVDGTKASLPFWQEMAVPSFPILVSFVALAVYRIRSSRTW